MGNYTPNPFMIQPAHLPPLRQTQRQTLSKHQLKVDKHNNNSTCLSFIYHDYVGLEPPCQITMLV